MWSGRPVMTFRPMRGALLLFAGAVAASLSLVLARFPGLVEQVYGSSLGPRIAQALSLATGWTPVSVSWLLLLGLAVWIGVRSARGVGRIRRGRFEKC